MEKTAAAARASWRTKDRRRDQLIDLMGLEVVRFQEESTAFDDVAAQVLALERGDLGCMTMLLFGGSATIEQLAAALQVRRSAVVAIVDRLQLAGYARRRPGGNGTNDSNDRNDESAGRIELTEHAREWIARIWDPLREDGARLLGSYSTRDLSVMLAFLGRARAVQERHARRLRKWLTLPSSAATKAHRRGGLSPAALRRVQLFVEANLERPIRLEDLAGRAGLSLYHFARAFRMSAGVTPRAFVEQRRIERAKQLIVSSDQSLADIAIASGFGTQSRLTTTLRQRTGFTPAEYRRGKSRPRARS